MLKSAHSVEINHSDVPIRLFKSDFLEFFTHISPVTVVVIWLPVAIFFLARGVIQLPAGAWRLVISGRGAARHLHLVTDRVHPASLPLSLRAEDGCPGKGLLPVPRRPPCPAAAQDPAGDAAGTQHPAGVRLLWAVSPGGGPACWACRTGSRPLFAGFILGYLTYDLTHYATHHFPMRSGYLKYLKRYHMMHHLQDAQRALRRQLAGVGLCVPHG